MARLLDLLDEIVSILEQELLSTSKETLNN